MKEAAVGASADLVDDIGLEIGVDSPRDVLAVTCVGGVSNVVCIKVVCDALTSLREEGAETLIGVGGLALLGEEAIGLTVAVSKRPANKSRRGK